MKQTLFSQVVDAVEHRGVILELWDADPGEREMSLSHCLQAAPSQLARVFVFDTSTCPTTAGRLCIADQPIELSDQGTFEVVCCRDLRHTVFAYTAQVLTQDQLV